MVNYANDYTWQFNWARSGGNDNNNTLFEFQTEPAINNMWQQGLSNNTSTVVSDSIASKRIPTFRLEYTKTAITNAEKLLDNTKTNTAIPGLNISGSFTTMLENLADNGSTFNLLNSTVTTPQASQNDDDYWKILNDKLTNFEKHGMKNNSLP